MDFLAMREGSGAFAQMAGVQRHDLTLTGRGNPSVVSTVVVTPEVFSLLGEKPLMGRTFFSEASKKGAPAEVLLSEGLWRSRFGADPHIVGSSINLDQRAFTVIGIMPADFHVPLVGNGQQIWIPLGTRPAVRRLDGAARRTLAESDRASEAGSFPGAGPVGDGGNQRQAGDGIPGGKQQTARLRRRDPLRD